MSRTDLLELTTSALIALANPGFVKRARKDLDAGRTPQLSTDSDQTVTAVFDDGVVTQLAAGAAVKDATCSCPASGWCRHRVILVLAYQDTHADSPDDARDEVPAWSPAGFDDQELAAVVGATVLATAAEEAVTVRLSAVDGVPTAQLPLNVVRFFSSGSLSHARCDCNAPAGCIHLAQAVWAFRRAEDRAGSAMTGQVTVEWGDRAVDASLGELESMTTDLTEACREVILIGAGNADSAVFTRFDRVAERARRLGWSWVVADIDEIVRQVRSRQDRSTAADPQRLARLLAEAPARLVSARAVVDGTAPTIRTVEEILGIGTPGSVQLAHLRLVSLGAQVWAGKDGTGAQIHLLDPDTGQISVMEGKWDGLAPPGQRRMLGTTVARVAASQVVTGGATRYALGVVEIAKDRRKTSLNPLGPKSWPITLIDRGSSTPTWINHRTLADGVGIIEVTEVVDWGWDPAAQQLRAILTTPHGEMVLEWAHTSAAPGGVETLAAFLSEGSVRMVTGVVTRRGGQTVIAPLAVASDELAAVPAVAPPREHTALPPPPRRPGTAQTKLVDEVRRAIAAWTNRGLRQQARAALEQLAALAEQLERAGLITTGQLLCAVVRTAPEDPVRAADLFCRAVLLVNAVDQRLTATGP